MILKKISSNGAIRTFNGIWFGRLSYLVECGTLERIKRMAWQQDAIVRHKCANCRTSSSTYFIYRAVCTVHPVEGSPANAPRIDQFSRKYLSVVISVQRNPCEHPAAPSTAMRQRSYETSEGRKEERNCGNFSFYIFFATTFLSLGSLE